MEHTNKILVIGGVHLDILTNYIDSTANTNFRDGTISIGIGGVGFNASLEEIQKLIRTVKSEVPEAAFLSPQQKEWISNHTAVIEEDVNKNGNPSESKQKEWYNQLCQFVGLISNSIKIANTLPLWS